MMKKKYAIFIITHERAERQITLESLKECGYTGDWYLICDDKDRQLEEYKKKYGDKVVVFSKEEYLPKMDLLTNEIRMNSSVYVRNATYDIAKKLGYQFFGQFDDDLKDFTYRFEKEGSLATQKVKNITKYFDLLVDYMEEANLASIGVMSSGNFVGGLETYYSKPKFNICQSFFCNTKKRLIFDGLLAVDLNAVVRASKENKVMVEPYFMQKTSPDRGSKDGGLKETYDASNEYVWNFYPIVYSPSNVSIYIKNGFFRTRRETSKMIPKIISERYRK